MTTIYAIRHGQTEANRDGIIQGHRDSPLTDMGRDSGRLKGEKLAGVKFDAVYCSDLQRSVSTLDIVSERVHGMPSAGFTKALREIDFGEYTWSLKDDIMPTVLRHKTDTTMKYPGGESGDDLRARVKGFVEETLLRHPGGVVLVVAHYGVLETIVRLYTDHPAEEWVLIGEEDVLKFTFDGDRAVLEVL